MAGQALIREIIYLAVLGAALIAGSRRKDAIFIAFACTLPWVGLMADVGVTITLDRVFAGLLLVLGMRSGRQSVPGALAAFIIYCVVDTAAMSVDLPATSALYSPLRGAWRWALQIPMWTLLVGPSLYTASSQNFSIVRVYRALLLSIGLLAALGIVQVAVYGATGVDILPINLFESAAGVRSGLIDSDRFGTVFRASSLGGEPKHLAYSLVVGLSILQADAQLGGPLQISKRVRVALVALFSACLLLTFSTQGYLLVGLNLVLLPFAQGTPRRGRVWARWAPAAAGMAMILGLAAGSPEARELVQGRTVERIASTGAVEDWNQAVIGWLKDNPQFAVIGTGLGNVHLYASRYIPEYATDYMTGNVFVAKAGALRLLSELGVVGLLLFLWMYWRPLKRWKVERSGKPVNEMHRLIAIAVLADFLLSADGPYYVFLTLAISYSIFSIVRSGQFDEGIGVGVGSRSA